MDIQALKEVLGSIEGTKALVVGDMMLDRYVWGAVDRISQEAPVPVVEVTKTEDRLGGAANAALNLKELGVDVSVAGMVGDDEEGNRLLSLFDKHGIDKEGVLVDRSRPTTLKTRVVAHSQQVVRIDREIKFESGVALQEAFSSVIESKLEQSQVVVLSDYGKGALSGLILGRFGEWGKQKRFSLQSRPLVLDPHPRNHHLYSHITVAKPNRKEASLASGLEINGRKGADEAAERLLEQWKAELLVITLSESGMLLRPRKGDGRYFDTVAQQVFDVSGAGDTVTAVISGALGAGVQPALACELANIAAGIAVSQVGTSPVSVKQIEEALHA